MSRQSDAIRDYFDKNGILQKDVCEALGIHTGTLSNILSGRYGISKNTAKKMARRASPAGHRTLNLIPGRI